MVIPKTLAKNSGYDPQEAVVKLQVGLLISSLSKWSSVDLIIAGIILWRNDTAFFCVKTIIFKLTWPSFNLKRLSRWSESLQAWRIPWFISYANRLAKFPVSVLLIESIWKILLIYSNYLWNRHDLQSVTKDFVGVWVRVVAREKVVLGLGTCDWYGLGLQ